jgi:hypothetical protein
MSGRLDGLATTFSISLDDGSSVLCATGTTSNASIPAGAFIDVVLTCATGATVPSGFLGINLNGVGRQMDFDNVQLNVTSTSVPEPPLSGACAMALRHASIVANPQPWMP